MKDSWRDTADSIKRGLRHEVKCWFEAQGHADCFPQLTWPTRLAYLWLAHYLASSCENKTPLIVGVGGGQGAGKSTLTHFLARLLVEQYGLRTQILSLDDFYLTKIERQRLSMAVHPMLATRGVPGTHDIAALNDVLDGLERGHLPLLPQFDKAADDRLTDKIPTISQPNIIFLEGWCVGAQPEEGAQLKLPINSLEEEQDPKGSWRHWVNQQLASTYATLFQRLDILVFMQVPGMSSVSQWRFQQEQQLVNSAIDECHPLKSQADIDCFIQYYERITRSMLQRLPGSADLVVELLPDHQVKDVYCNAT